MTELTRNLAAAGWIERRDDPTHRRKIAVRLTPAGRGRLRSAHTKVATLEDHIEAGLPTADRRAVRRWLVRCTDQLDPSAAGRS